jgi:CheY-like chemotaxis protein/anti-sigma regulatory factor (Ser/Thr protein kinase)
MRGKPQQTPNWLVRSQDTAAGTGYGPLHVMIVDGDAATRLQLGDLIGSMGHRVSTATSAAEALETYRRDRPDLVMLDVTMPDMNGIELAWRLRTLPSEGRIPIYFLSVPNEEEAVVAGLQAGGDDYLLKPVSARLLRAKLNVAVRLLDFQRQAVAKSAKLAELQGEREEELRIGAHLMERLVQTAGMRDPWLKSWNQPYERFSGDAWAAARTPSGALHVMLSDATGHGLAAALNALPLVQAFYAMTEKGFQLSTIASELNRRIRHLMPADRFVAAALAAIDLRNSTVEMWNGGMPPAIFLNAAGEVVQQWESRHLPLGILPADQFDSHAESTRFMSAGQLFMFSDGVVETFSGDAALASEAIVGALASQPPARRLHGLTGAIGRKLAGRRAHDDLSVIQVDLPEPERASAGMVENDRQDSIGEWLGDSRFGPMAEVREPASSAPAVPAGTAETRETDWNIVFSLGVGELRRLDAVPVMLSTLKSLHGIEDHSGDLFLLVSELFNNALDHGLLELDSSIKNRTGGFERYTSQRSERLQALRRGRVECRFQKVTLDDGPILKIRVQDTGRGFDFQKYITGAAMPAGGQMFGRGLMLVQSLSRTIRFLPPGNTVEVSYSLVAAPDDRA